MRKWGFSKIEQTQNSNLWLRFGYKYSKRDILHGQFRLDQDDHEYNIAFRSGGGGVGV